MLLIFDTYVFEVLIIEQFTIIRYAKDLQCNCGSATYSDRKTFNIVGIADTQVGYMAIFECLKCFEQYRHHINTIGRYKLEEFKSDLALMLYLKNHD